MKHALAFLFLLLLPLSLRADDDLVSIDATAGMITVQQNGILKTYRVKPFTDITINGQKSSAAQLRVGMQVAISLADPQTAAKVAARGNAPAATPGPDATTPSPFLTSRTGEPPTRRIVIKASVDGDDTVIVKDGKFHLQHGGWEKPKDVAINGIKWKTEWKDKDTEDFTAFNPPLAPFAGATVTVKMVRGRGEAKVTEPPTDANGQKLIVHLQDEGSGASEFEVRIT